MTIVIKQGERLSHAVGCAFAICLERKQKRERDAVQATYANEDGTFVRMSSFRQVCIVTFSCGRYVFYAFAYEIALQ